MENKNLEQQLRELADLCFAHNRRALEAERVRDELAALLVAVLDIRLPYRAGSNAASLRSAAALAASGTKDRLSGEENHRA
jgi:hypothetical protein